MGETGPLSHCLLKGTGLSNAPRYEDEEVWKEIPEWEGYRVSTHYRVESKWIRGNRFSPRRLGENWKPVSTERDAIIHGGQGRVMLYKDGKQTSRGLIVLVAEVHGLFRCAGKNGCGQLLGISQRVKSSLNANYCKPCDAAAKRSWRKKQPLAARESDLRRNYKLTNKQYDNMFWEQGGLCRICQEPPRQGNGCRFSPAYGAYKLVVDHNHSTGVIRDLLCGNCNRGGGYFKENPARLYAAAEYFHRHSDTG